MSAPETASLRDARAGVCLSGCSASIVEISGRRTRARESEGFARGLEDLARDRGVALPASGQAAIAPDHLVLSYRPDRWLLLMRAAPPAETAALWQAVCTGAGVAVDLSAGLAVLQLAGTSARDMLARGCRLDLHPEAFPTGRAAATIIAQVSVIIVGLPAGLLLLTPASTARHFSEWVAATAQPFGFIRQADRTLAALLGGNDS